MEEITLEEYQRMLAERKPSKYGNTQVLAEGHCFDSIAEHRRYGELKLQMHAGEITDLGVHPRFEIVPAFTDVRTGVEYKAVDYEADFVYMEGAQLVVEDIKGKRTDVFKLKEKLFRSKYPHIDFRIIEV